MLYAMLDKLSTDQHVWNAGIFVLFPIVLVLLYRFFDSSGALQTFFSLTIFDILILSFATLRLIRLITRDRVFSFGRVIFYNTSPDGTMTKPPKGFRRAIADLIECPWCVGIWAALLLTALYVASPLGRFFAVILTIAALGSFFQIVSRRIAGDTSNTYS
jgi:hypothetical protein